VYLEALGGNPSLILPGTWHNAAYSPSGHILTGGVFSLLKSEVLAIPGSMKTARFGGTPVTVAHKVFANVVNGRLWFDLSHNGTFVYAAGDVSKNKLALVDHSGHVVTTYGEHSHFETPSLSPDGKRMAYTQNCRIYVRDLNGGEPILLTTEAGAPQTWVDRTPIWNPDGSRIVYRSNRSGNWDLYIKDASGAGPSEALLTKELNQDVGSMRKDGTMSFTEIHPVTNNDIWILPPGEKPRSWLATAYSETKPAFSPDGRFIAYQSDRNERFEIYVSPFSDSNKQVRVSTAGGTCAAWSPKGDRLFFRQGTKIMAVDMRDGAPTGNLRLLFDGGWSLGTAAGLPLVPMQALGFQFAVTDDEHLLMVRAEPEAVPTKIHVIFNFFEELKHLVPTGRK